MWTRPDHRGHGVARAVAEALLAAARAEGYRAVRLDTLEWMTAARALYRSLGFVEIGPYYPNPLPGVVYMELAALRGAARAPAAGNGSLLQVDGRLRGPADAATPSSRPVPRGACRPRGRAGAARPPVSTQSRWCSTLADGWAR